MKECTINGRNYGVENLSGIVADASKNMETRVTGGGGYISGGSGFNAPIRSLNVVHSEIFLVDQQGRERSLQIEGINIACRPGHELAVTKLVHNNNKIEYIAAANYTTQSIFFNVLAINRLFEPHKTRLALISLIIGFFPFLLSGANIYITLIFGSLLGFTIFLCYFMYDILIGTPKRGRAFMAKYNIEDYN